MEGVSGADGKETSVMHSIIKIKNKKIGKEEKSMPFLCQMGKKYTMFSILLQNVSN